MPSTEQEYANGRELVNNYWPYDGPHNDDKVIEAARAADELTQYISNAVYGGTAKTLPYGSSVARLLGAFSSTLSNMEEVLGHLIVAEQRIGQDPTAYDERRDRPASATTAEAVTHITAARVHLEQTRDQMRKATSAAYRIGHDS